MLFLNGWKRSFHQKQVVINVSKNCKENIQCERLLRCLRFHWYKGNHEKCLVLQGIALTNQAFIESVYTRSNSLMFAKYKPGAAFIIGFAMKNGFNYTEYRRLKDKHEIKRSKMKIYLMH